MTFDAAALNVLSLIAHQIPHRNKNEPLVEIPLSEVVPEVPPETLGFFTRRLLRTLQSRGQDVEVDNQRTNNVLPGHLIAKLSGELDLVEFSQAAARHLYTVQGGTSSEGLLVVCELSLNGEAAVALMKLEEEEGVLVEDTEVGGLHTLSVVVLDSLLLTDNTRVFKAGVFWLEDDVLSGNISDEQQGHPSDIAEYFLGEFLGCRLTRRPAVLTRIFYDAVSDFISENVTDPQRKLDYQSALHAEMASNRVRIAPLQFINENFDLEHRAPLLTQLEEHDLSQQAFRKNIGRLGTRVAKSRIRTASGITISGKANEIDERVSSSMIDEQRVIVIRDTISDVS